jgi:hypothetical protein
MAKDIEILRKVNQLKSRIFYPRLNTSFQSTICFFCNDENEQIKPVGSGLFLKIHENYYVVTAAHVLAEHYNDTFVLLQDVELTIGGRIHSSPMPTSGNRDDDKIDISILKVDEYSRDKLLENFRPIQISEIGENHHLQDTSAYFSVGFPLTRTEKKWLKDEIKSIGYSYQTEPIFDYNFQRLGFTEETTLAFKFDGEVTNAINPHPHLSPDITGMSGSGFWNFFGTTEKHLIGVVIQKETNPGYKAILATKIDVVIAMINEMG